MSTPMSPRFRAGLPDQAFRVAAASSVYQAQTITSKISLMLNSSFMPSNTLTRPSTVYSLVTLPLPES